MAHFPLIAMGRMKHRIISKGSPLVWLCVFLPLTRSENVASANGIYGNGIGADAMSMGGAEVAWAADPLSAMTANPAGLGFLSKPEIDLGAEGAVLEGNFTKAGSGGSLDSSLNALPEGAFAYPLKQIPLTFGISVAPHTDGKERTENERVMGRAEIVELIAEVNERPRAAMHHNH